MWSKVETLSSHNQSSISGSSLTSTGKGSSLLWDLFSNLYKPLHRSVKEHRMPQCKVLLSTLPGISQAHNTWQLLFSRNKGSNTPWSYSQRPLQMVTQLCRFDCQVPFSFLEIHTKVCAHSFTLFRSSSPKKAMPASSPLMELTFFPQLNFSFPSDASFIPKPLQATDFNFTWANHVTRKLFSWWKELNHTCILLILMSPIYVKSFTSGQMIACMIHNRLRMSWIELLPSSKKRGILKSQSPVPQRWPYWHI